MTSRALAARGFSLAFLLASAALTSACERGGDAQGEASGNVETSTDTKASVTVNKVTPSDSAGARVEGRAAPGQAQLDVAAAQLAEANARLNEVANVGASVEDSAQPGNPSLKVNKPGALVDAKVQTGKPSLAVGKAGTLIDANVQAGQPSLNIGGLKAAASSSAGAGTPANTSKAGVSAGAKAKVSLGVGQ